MSEQSFSVALRIRHPSLDPEFITQELSIEPDYSWKAGDIRPTAIGVSTEGRYPETYWIGRIRFDPPRAVPATLEGTVMLAAVLLKSRKTLWQKIQSDGGRAELLATVVSADSTNVELSSDLMSLLSGLGLSISFEPEPGHMAVA